MDRRDDDMEAHAWPGFVDILSAVIIMFVFFVLVIAIILSILSIERVKDKELSADEGEPIASSMAEREMIDLLQSGEVTIEDIKESALNKQKAEAMAETINDLEQEIQQIQIGLSNSDSDENVIIEEENAIVILYNRNVVTLNAETQEKISAFVQSQKTQGRKMSLISSENPNASYRNSSRKTALARSFNVRNVLIENEWANKNINIDFKQPEQIQDSYDWIRIKATQ